MTPRWIHLFGDCAPAVGMVSSTAILTFVAWEVSVALSSAHRVFVFQESVVASIVAEEAAFAAVERIESRQNLNAFTIDNPAGLDSRVEPMSVGSDGDAALRITVSGKNGRVYRYRCDLLAGAAPRSLENPLSIRHSVVVSRPELQAWLRNNPDVHMNPMGDGKTMASLLDPRVVPKRIAASHIGDSTGIGTDTGSSPGLVADESIALLRLDSGTDRRDFKLVENRSNTWRPRVPASGVIVLDGHLWIDRRDHPLVVVLQRSLTIVVNGNIYLGRGINTRGPGRLILAVRRVDGTSFCDRNGDGRWSGLASGDTILDEGKDKDTDTDTVFAGPIEGSGMIYLGLPGTSDAQPQDIEIVASIVAEAEVYVRAKAISVHGALVLGQGITWIDGSILKLPGGRLPNIQRERIPGFRRTGTLRPGLLSQGR